MEACSPWVLFSNSCFTLTYLVKVGFHWVETFSSLRMFSAPSVTFEWAVKGPYLTSGWAVPLWNSMDAKEWKTFRAWGRTQWWCKSAITQGQHHTLPCTEWYEEVLKACLEQFIPELHSIFYASLNVISLPVFAPPPTPNFVMECNHFVFTLRQRSETICFTTAPPIFSDCRRPRVHHRGSRSCTSGQSMGL